MNAIKYKIYSEAYYIILVVNSNLSMFYKDCNMPPIRLREGLAFQKDIPKKSQAFPKADGRHTILFKVRRCHRLINFS